MNHRRPRQRRAGAVGSAGIYVGAAGVGAQPFARQRGQGGVQRLQLGDRSAVHAGRGLGAGRAAAAGAWRWERVVRAVGTASGRHLVILILAAPAEDPGRKSSGRRTP